MIGDIQRIMPRSGIAIQLKKGQFLTIMDPEGEQVSDMLCYSSTDRKEYLSSGRSIDYASKLFLTKGDTLYSNRSRPMFKIIEDDVGRHDFLLTPCSKETFKIIYGDENPHHGCQGNFEKALRPFGVSPDEIPIAFNVFMHTKVDGETGEITVLPPKSGPGDTITFEAQMDMIVAMTACSAGQSNNFQYGPIDFLVTNPAPGI